MSKINKIQLSGTVYDIQDLDATKAVELTQAQYNALQTKDPDTFYIITDASPIDISDYWTSAQTQSAITEAISGKVDTTAFNTYSASTNARISEDEEVTAAALNAINDKVDAIDIITVDSALSSTSENPVQNKVIYQAIGDIETLLAAI